MNSLPSLSLLPSVPPPAKGKRQKRGLLPCQPELRYEDGEILNRNIYMRTQGGSSSFLSSPLKIIPLSPPFPTSWEELERINVALGVQTSVQTVLRELYRTEGFPDAPRPPRPLHKYQVTDGNVHKPQYYTQTLKNPATVVHIVTDERFWDMSEVLDDLDMPKIRTSDVGRLAYTSGILWCNSSPNWTWKSRGDTMIRCRIDLPAGAQVIIDRSPVDPDGCEFDEEGGRSLFPDVLLLPGQFRVTDVKRYKTDDYESDYDGDSIEPLDSADSFITSNFLVDASNFLDVRMEAVVMMRVPDKL